MKLRRIKFVLTGVFLMLSLAVSSFAAPLCACLETSQAASHDCCEKMKMHCPPAMADAQKSISSDNAPHSNCECSLEKRENAPTKIAGKKFAEKGQAVSSAPILPQIFLAKTETGQPLFIAQNTAEVSFPDQTPARAPPCL